MIVTVGFRHADKHYEADEKRLIEMLSMPIDNRQDFFFKHAKATKIHSDEESEWYYDCSGNQSVKAFWGCPDGEKALAYALDLAPPQ